MSEVNETEAPVPAKSQLLGAKIPTRSIFQFASLLSVSSVAFNVTVILSPTFADAGASLPLISIQDATNNNIRGNVAIPTIIFLMFIFQES